MRPRQNGRHFPDDIFKCIFLNENVWILIKISVKFVPWGPINDIPALVQIMAWRLPGDKPLSEPMLVSLLMHMCHSASMSSLIFVTKKVPASDNIRILHIPNNILNRLLALRSQSQQPTACDWADFESACGINKLHKLTDITNSVYAFTNS